MVSPIEPQPNQGTPVTELEGAFGILAEAAFDIHDDRSLAVHYGITLPALHSRKLIQPILDAAPSDLGKDTKMVHGDVLLARQAGNRKLLAVLGNLTLDNKPVMTTLPVSYRTDYFPPGFQDRGPYSTFVVHSDGDTLDLRAKDAYNKWVTLSTDTLRDNPGDFRPGVFFAKQLMGRLLLPGPRGALVGKTIQNVPGRKMLPPDLQ